MPGISRRHFVRSAAGVWLLASSGSIFADCPPTPRNDAGPYWRDGAPFRERLWSDEAGDLLTITGTVTDSQCRRVAGAVLDLWQADAQGHYDSDLPGFIPRDYRLRGRVRADARGTYRFETIRPAPYGMRPAHIHLIVTAPGKSSLVTQIYFAGDPFLSRDPLRMVREPLIVRLQDAPSGAAMPRARRHSRGTFDITVS